MRQSFGKSFGIFKYFALVFTMGYWIYVILDDYNFIKQYGDTNWLEYLGIWTTYFLVYFSVFSIYYWAIATAFILVYHKLFKRTVA